jgi:hypothetical protein
MKNVVQIKHGSNTETAQLFYKAGKKISEDIFLERPTVKPFL